MITLIRKLSTNNQPFDMALIAQYFTMDVITHLALGHPFGYLKRNEDVYGFLATTRSLMPALELGCNHSWIKRLLESRLMQTIVAPSPTDTKGIGAVIGVARKVISERFKPDAIQPKDMLGSFKSHGLSQSLTENEAVLQITVGADSTATAIRMTLLYILTNPSIYAQLRQEIDNEKLSHNTANSIISSASARTMPYLQACIRESLRLFPPMQGLQNKVAPPHGITVSGLYIPGNVEICTNYHSMMRRCEIFGPDAEVFRPSRWTEANEEVYNRMLRTQELVFGTSRYTCLGKNIAMMELDKVVMEVRCACSFFIFCLVLPKMIANPFPNPLAPPQFRLRHPKPPPHNNDLLQRLPRTNRHDADSESSFVRTVNVAKKFALSEKKFGKEEGKTQFLPTNLAHRQSNQSIWGSLARLGGIGQDGTGQSR